MLEPESHSQEEEEERIVQGTTRHLKIDVSECIVF